MSPHFDIVLAWKGACISSTRAKYKSICFKQQCQHRKFKQHKYAKVDWKWGRLPGAVLLVRARILQRLRGVPLSANRWMLTVICNLEFSKGESGHYMKIIIYFMSSIICLRQNCHDISAQYQDWLPPMLLMVKLWKHWIDQFDAIFSGLMMDPFFFSDSTFRWTSMCKNWVIVTHLILMECPEKSSTFLQLIILFMMSIIQISYDKSIYDWRNCIVCVCMLDCIDSPILLRDV